MRRIAAAVLVFALLFCACGNKKDNISQSNVSGAQTESELLVISANELAQLIINDKDVMPDSLQYINSVYDADAVAAYVENFYCLTPPEWSQCAIYRSDAADNAFEVSIFKLSSLAEPDIVLNNLEEYRLSRQGDFFGYNPKQAAIVEDSIVCISEDGGWAGVFICDGADEAQDAFNARLGMSTSVSVPVINEKPKQNTETGNLPSYWLPYIDPEIDDMSLWDNSAVVEAIKSGNDEGLDRQGQKLFKKVNKVIDKYISDDMSILEKEKAIYKWLCDNCEYDQRHYELINSAPRESYEPYGAIVEGKAVCLGFATAFQLFMDVLDIECITVVGAAFSSMEDHAWNMVRIDDEWYCVDATWDEGAYGFGYFNKSSEYFALTDHQWDYEACPIAQPDETGAGI